ncbi:MAG: Crp/Fnr family transcriptional regulator [Cytophagales bacterium]|nr:Crp/Fnr family transcriptional regulator [Cytophagales bacterium]
MGKESKLWFFEDVDLYEVFCPHKIGDMHEKHVFQTYNKESFVYFSDDPSDHVYLVKNGRIKIGTYSDDGKEIIKAILQPGEIFGELALAGEETRGDFAQAIDKDVEVCPLTLDDMETLMRRHQGLTLQMTKLIGFRLLKAERRIESLVFKDSRTRIIEYLCDLATERGEKVGFEILVKKFFTHQDIANLTATSRQTVTTVLNELRDKNLINFDRKRLLIRDLDQLKKEG